MSVQNAWLLARHVNCFKGKARQQCISKRQYQYSACIYCVASPDLYNVTMKKHKVVVEEQGKQEFKPKRSRQKLLIKGQDIMKAVYKSTCDRCTKCEDENKMP